jgi:flagellar protein FlgJ
MDIGNISGMYSDILSANNQSTTKLENKLNTDMTQATDEELMDACKQFEAYFVEQMFKSMMKTVPKNEEMSASTTTLTDFYKDEMLKELAADSTETNSLGLAQTLYEQMKRNYEL